MHYPCPCGHFGDPVRKCTCTHSVVSRYQKRIEVPRVEYEKLSDDGLGEPSAAIRERVEGARDHQRKRFGDTGFMANADTPALAAQV